MVTLRGVIKDKSKPTCVEPCNTQSIKQNIPTSDNKTKKDNNITESKKNTSDNATQPNPPNYKTQISLLQKAFREAFKKKIQKDGGIEQIKQSQEPIQQELNTKNSNLNKIIFEGTKTFFNEGRIYTALNISRSANVTEISKAYIKLSPFFHQDKLPQDMPHDDKEARYELLNRLNIMKDALFYHANPNLVEERNPLKPIQENRDLKQKKFEIALENFDKAYKNYTAIENNGTAEEISQAETRLDKIEQELEWASTEKDAAIADYSKYNVQIEKIKYSLRTLFNNNVAALPTNQTIIEMWKHEKERYDHNISSIHFETTNLESQLIEKDEEINNLKIQDQHEAITKLREFSKILITYIKAFSSIQTSNCDAECQSNKMIANPYLAKKNNINCIDHYKIDSFFSEEGADYSIFNKILNNYPTYIPHTQLDIIPKILHSVWFVPRICHEDDLCIYNFFYTQNKYLSSYNVSNEWVHYFWTSNITAMPHASKNILTSMGATLKSLNELNFKTYYNETQWRLHLAIKFWSSNNYNYLATNVAKFLILQKYGGVYINSDIQLINSSILDKLSSLSESFFVTKQYENNILLEDRFLGAKPNSKIINDTIHTLERNIFNVEDTPNFVKYPCSNFARMVATTGSIPLSISFAKKSQEQDIILHEHFNIDNHGYNVTEFIQNDSFDQTVLGEILHYDNISDTEHNY